MCLVGIEDVLHLSLGYFSELRGPSIKDRNMESPRSTVAVMIAVVAWIPRHNMISYGYLLGRFLPNAHLSIEYATI